jgi:hypothetical protein
MDTDQDQTAANQMGVLHSSEVDHSVRHPSAEQRYAREGRSQNLNEPEWDAPLFSNVTGETRMAFKLTKDEQKTKTELSANLEKAWASVEDAVGAYNDEVNVAKQKITAVIASFNDTAAQAATFIQEVASRAEGEIDEKTEKWQESDKGQEAVSWKDEWSEFDADGIENIDWPEELAIEQPTVVDLDALPEEAE